MAKMTRINGDKLKMAFNLKGISIYKAGEKLGYSEMYIHNAINRGTIRTFDIDRINYMFGIPFEDYEYVEPTPEPVVEEKTEPTVSRIEIHEELIVELESAMYRAMVRAIADSVDVIVEAVTKAWKNL